MAITILQSWKCQVYVVTRGESHRQRAAALGATWVGNEDEKPPVELDRAVTFAPSGKVVVSALASLRKGGVVAINAIHLDQMPAFDYDELLWGERQIRSVANMTRQDARDFLALASASQIDRVAQRLRHGVPSVAEGTSAVLRTTTLWENERNGDLCAGAGAHCRSLGCARDDKVEGSDFY